MNERPMEEACYWLAQRAQPRPSRPALSGKRVVDFAIVGGGFTGLWTALYLRALDPRAEIAVVEAGTAAYGASGRNAGMVSNTIDHSHALAIAHFGEEEARRLALLGRSNVDEMFDFLTAHGIDCDLERNGTLMVALTPGHMEYFSENVEVARSLGVDDLRLLDQDQARAEIHSDRYLGALFDPRGAILDPVALVDGLAREAERVGVTIAEHTRVLSLEAGGARARLRSEGGEIVARKVILAMSAYTHTLLPEVSFRFLPLFDYVLVSEPLDGARRERLGWARRQGVNDARSFFNYYRLTKDDRVLWGTSEAAYYSGGRVDPSCDHSERHYRELRASFAWHFPDLSDVSFPYAWGGAICATTRFTPFFGAAGGGRILYSLGFTGHGIATTHLAGKILAHLALARPSPLMDLELVRKMPFPYPPEPMRTWAVDAVTRALRRVDRGESPGPLLRVLDALGIGLSS